MATAGTIKKESSCQKYLDVFKTNEMKNKTYSNKIQFSGISQSSELRVMFWHVYTKTDFKGHSLQILFFCTYTWTKIGNETRLRQ